MIAQTIFMIAGTLLAVLLARLVAAWVRRLPDKPPVDVEQALLMQIELLRDRPQAEREQLLAKIKQRLAV